VYRIRCQGLLRCAAAADTPPTGSNGLGGGGSGCMYDYDDVDDLCLTLLLFHRKSSLL